jgi:hypothetical protein
VKAWAKSYREWRASWDRLKRSRGAARIEFLKGLRSLIDEKIERANRAQTASKGASITVE